MMKTRKTTTILVIILIISLGIFSRVLDFGNILLDKYLGDMLYALMFYFIFKLFIDDIKFRFGLTFFLMIFSEILELIGVSEIFRQSGTSFGFLISVLIGSKFSFIDILVYLLGLMGICIFDQLVENRIVY